MLKEAKIQIYFDQLESQDKRDIALHQMKKPPVDSKWYSLTRK
jgi:hypothetical protein